MRMSAVHCGWKSKVCYFVGLVQHICVTGGFTKKQITSWTFCDVRVFLYGGGNLTLTLHWHSYQVHWLITIHKSSNVYLKELSKEMGWGSGIIQKLYWHPLGLCQSMFLYLDIHGYIHDFTITPAGRDVWEKGLALYSVINRAPMNTW